jgi:hypothetical protein
MNLILFRSPWTTISQLGYHLVRLDKSRDIDYYFTHLSYHTIDYHLGEAYTMSHRLPIDYWTLLYCYRVGFVSPFWVCVTSNLKCWGSCAHHYLSFYLRDKTMKTTYSGTQIHVNNSSTSNSHSRSIWHLIYVAM